MAKINLKEAKEFLDYFGYDLVTVATIQEPGAAAKKFRSKHFYSTKESPNGKPKIAHSLPLGKFGKEFTVELAQLQKIKRAVYFTVNESDGVSSEDQPNPNRKENIISLKACFCDTDNCKPQLAARWFKDCGISPHLVVETSPGKYHFYFLLEPTPLSDTGKWKAIQKCMEWLGDRSIDKGMDKTMHDLTQLMRLPGFLHQKNEPFKVTLRKVNHHSPYNIDELFHKVGAEEFYTSEVEVAPYEYPTHKISPGERHEAFRNYALSVANDLRGDPLALEKTLDAVDGFMLKKFTKARPFLQGGSRRKEVIRTVKDAVNLAHKSIIENLPPLDYDTVDEVDSNKFALSEGFFYHAPGLVGEIVKEICRKSLYPVPAFAFASTVAMLGTLRSPYVTSEFGHAPSNYFLCLAPTGTGKSYPQEVLTNTLHGLGIPDVASNKVRSARGIEMFLHKQKSNGLINLDEGKEFLASFNDAGAPAYIKQMKPLLLELYSKTNTEYYHTGWVGDEKQKHIVLQRPRLNVIVFGVVRTLSEAFSIESVQDGLMQRFLVLTYHGKRDRNPNYEPAASLNGHIASELREILLESKIETLETQDKLERLRTRYKAIDDESRRAKIKRVIEKLEKSVAGAAKKTIRFDVDAADLLWKFADKMDKKVEAELKKDRGFEGIFTRAAEQVGRLATAISLDKTISKDVVQYCIDLVDSRTKAMHEYTWKYLGISSYHSEKQALLNKIIKIYRDSGQPVRYREVFRKFSNARNRRHFRDLVDGLYDEGSVRMIEPPVKGGRGKTGETFIPLPQNDLLGEEE